MWGNTYSKDNDGVSAAIAFTKKGDSILQNISCELRSHSLDVIMEGQMKNNPVEPSIRERVLTVLRNKKKSINDAVFCLQAYQKYQRRIGYIKHPFRIFTRIFKNIK